MFIIFYYIYCVILHIVIQVYPANPVAGPGAARSVWELSPDPDMVGHLPNNPISGHQSHGSSKDTRHRHRPDDNIYADETNSAQSPTDETKRIFELLRAGLDNALCLKKESLYNSSLKL